MGRFPATQPPNVVVEEAHRICNQSSSVCEEHLHGVVFFPSVRSSSCHCTKPSRHQTPGEAPRLQDILSASLTSCRHGSVEDLPRSHCRRGGQLKLGAAAATVAPEHSRTHLHVRNPASSMPSSLERHPARRKERRLWLLISALATPREELRTVSMVRRLLSTTVAHASASRIPFCGPDRGHHGWPHHG